MNHIILFWKGVSPLRGLTLFDSITDICIQHDVLTFLLLSLFFMAPAYINDSLTLSVSISALSRSINISENLIFLGGDGIDIEVRVEKRKWKTTSVLYCAVRRT